jgi:3-oxoadipate enol-lactonase
MPFAEIGAHRLYYEVHGSGEPLLAIAGTGQDHTAWREVMPHWSARWPTVVFDNRDVGQSSLAIASYDVADMAHDVVSLADSLALRRFHLIGLSLGGAIAQEVALSVPERVRSVVLAVSWSKTTTWQDQSVLARDAHRIARARRLLARETSAQSSEALARQIEAARLHDASARLPSLRCPVLVVAASEDVIVPPGESAILAQLIPDARLEVLEGAGHEIQRHPDFGRVVAEFLSGDAQPRR